MKLDKYYLIGIIAASMKEEGYTLDQIDKVCTQAILNHETKSKVEIMQNADDILRSCLVQSNDLRA